MASIRRLTPAALAALLFLALAAAFIAVGGGVARADTTTCPAGTYPPNPACTTVAGESVTRTVTAPTAVQGTSSSLPFTGAAVVPTLAIGVVLLGGGVALTTAGARRRRNAHTSAGD